MSVSATRTLAAIGVLAAGIVGATLFRKEPGSQTPPVAERSWGVPGVQWQAAPYPDAISLPNSVANWPSSSSPTASLAHTEANAVAANAGGATAQPSADSPATIHPVPSAASVLVPDALASAATSAAAAAAAKPSPETTRLPASIGNPARPRDPLAMAKEPPELAPRYGDAQGYTGFESATRRLPTVSAATHVIRDGDTLQDIARQHLGDADRWQEIYELNRQALPDPEILPIGLELRLPPTGMVPVRRPHEQPRAVVDFASTRAE